MTTASLEARRYHIRLRTLGNFAARLMAEAARTAGRLRVLPGQDGILLAFHDVRTLVRDGRSFAFARQDFMVILSAPSEWPFVRKAALRPMVFGPSGFLHPNSNGVGICIELEGVLPETVPDLIYGNLIIRRHRLDHIVDDDCTRFVRSHLQEFPSDRRPLYPADATTPEPVVDDGPAPAGRWTPLAGDATGLPGTLPVQRWAAGGLGLAVPTLSEPTFLRFAAPGEGLVDAARRAYLSRTNLAVRAGVPGWLDGPGLAVDSATADPTALRRELSELALAVDALGDPRVAASYLELQSPSTRNRHGETARLFR